MFSSRVPSDLDPNALARAVAALRARGIAIIDLTETNPTRAGLRYAEDLLGPLSEAASLRYEPEAFGLESARAAVAREHGEANRTVDPSRVVLTASTSEAYSFLFKLLCDPGDAVLVPVPSYPLFDHLTRLDAVEACSYALDYHGTWNIDFASLERALTPGTRAVLVVSPNNPTGSLLGADDLETLVTFCAENNLALIGDEVFSDYLLDPRENAASVLDQDAALSFSLGGLSKSVGLPQLKLGWIVAAGPRSLVNRALARLEIICDAYLSVGTPVQQAAGVLLARGREVRRLIGERVRENLYQLHAATAGTACTVLRVEGGWSAVVRVPATRLEERLVLDLLEEDHVLVHPGYFFDFPREAYLVVSLLPRPRVFEEGVARVVARATADLASS